MITELKLNKLNVHPRGNGHIKQRGMGVLSGAAKIRSNNSKWHPGSLLDMVRTLASEGHLPYRGSAP